MPYFDVKVPLMGYRLYKDVEAEDAEAAIAACMGREPELVLNPDEDGHIGIVPDTDLAPLGNPDSYPINPSATESYQEDDPDKGPPA